MSDLTQVFEAKVTDAINQWKSITNVSHFAFLIQVSDTFINLAETVQGATGAEKKAAVLGGLNVVYDVVIVGVLPLWLKPFGGVIKTVTLSMLSELIDFAVAKYNNGQWTTVPTKV